MFSCNTLITDLWLLMMASYSMSCIPTYSIYTACSPYSRSGCMNSVTQPSLKREDKDNQGPAWGLKAQLERRSGRNKGGDDEHSSAASKIRVPVAGPTLAKKIEQVHAAQRSISIALNLSGEVCDRYMWMMCVYARSKVHFTRVDLNRSETGRLLLLLLYVLVWQLLILHYEQYNTVVYSILCYIVVLALFVSFSTYYYYW